MMNKQLEKDIVEILEEIELNENKFEPEYQKIPFKNSIAKAIVKRIEEGEK